MSAHLKDPQNAPRPTGAGTRSRSRLGRLPWLVGLAAIGVSQLGAGCQSVQNLIPMTPGATSFGSGAEEIAKTIAAHPAKNTLASFDSQAALESYLEDLKKKVGAQDGYDDDGEGYSMEDAGGMAPQAAPSPSAPPPAQEAKAEADSAGEDESVTNNQHAGVDEGGIVKVHGDQLVVLRRGRLFTVDVSGDRLTPISALDAFAPSIDPRGTWYDEMLISDDTVVVIGYSYDRGGTEIGLFNISDKGELSYKDTYHLRSDDYYSSRNYASRLIGDKLIFYTPLYVDLWSENIFDSFPALRKWRWGAKDDDFRPITTHTDIYRPVFETDEVALHTVTTCDLGAPEMTCKATALFGPPGRVFYVSPSSVFVWTTDWRDRTNSAVYRMPLDGTAPSVLRVAGGPVDQFSFLESQDGFLNVLVRSETNGEAMWTSEKATGQVALMRVPLTSFSNGQDAAPISAYRAMPRPEGHTFQNRFVGDHILYGTGSGWGHPNKNNEGTLFAAKYASDGPTTRIGLVHGVDRIENMGGNAVAVGTDGQDLFFSSVDLSGLPKVASRYQRKGASQGELRSHGFFYKPESQSDGLLGLPIREPAEPGYSHLFHESASVLYLKNRGLNLSELGTLASRPDRAADDKCKASCVDWYGNARPLFLKGRVFALLGYELVEGRLDDRGINERRRVSFAPTGKTLQVAE